MTHQIHCFMQKEVLGARFRLSFRSYKCRLHREIAGRLVEIVGACGWRKDRKLTKYYSLGTIRNLVPFNQQCHKNRNKRLPSSFSSKQAYLPFATLKLAFSAIMIHGCEPEIWLGYPLHTQRVNVQHLF